MANLKSEAGFFDTCVQDNVRKPLAKYYAITRDSQNHYEELLFRDCEGKQVLEYGCGTGSYALPMAKRGARVFGIDISPGSVDLARKHAAEAGEIRAEFKVMDAMNLEYDDSSFDLVIGTGILHHLDIHKSFREICRVLKPGGRACFYEPLGHNPALNLFRKATPKMRTDDEHPLRRCDLLGLKEYFDTSSYRFFHLATFGALPFLNTKVFWPLVDVCEGMDRVAFRLVPLIRWWAWYTTLEYIGPKKADIA